MPPARLGYWYCAECTPLLEPAADVAQDRQLQDYLLGGRAPPGLS